jgi:hypothetical protein
MSAITIDWMSGRSLTTGSGWSPSRSFTLPRLVAT